MVEWLNGCYPLGPYSQEIRVHDFELHDFCPLFVFHVVNCSVEIMILTFEHDFLVRINFPSPMSPTPGCFRFKKVT